MIADTKEIFKHQSPYQLIQIQEDKFGIGRILLLNGTVQLTTYDQHRYHECLVVVPYLHTRYAARIAILGGGDGYAAKVLLDNFPVEHITLVDIDSAVVEASKAFLDFPDDPRLDVVYEDAGTWIGKHRAEGYDLIIADYTDPTFSPAAKLYTVEHLTKIREALNEGGAFSMQMGSPYGNPKAAACLAKTMVQAFEGWNVAPYKVHMPMLLAPSQNGFCMAAQYPMQLAVPQNLKFLNAFNYQSLFVLGNDEWYDWDGVGISTEDNLLYSVVFKSFYQHNVKEWEIED
jgi:spermidine synthase